MELHGVMEDYIKEVLSINTVFAITQKLNGEMTHILIQCVIL